MKILICGDSYMALDKRRSHLNHIHWSNHLGTHIIDNRAQPGASNTMILMQLNHALHVEKYDRIVLGFTFQGRLEIDDQYTTVHDHLLTQEQRKMTKLYRENIWYPAEATRNITICKYAVMYARSHAPTVFALNGLQKMIELATENKLMNFYGPDLQSETLPLQLTNHDEWPNPTAASLDYGSFHVRDPAIHLEFAQQVRKHLSL